MLRGTSRLIVRKGACVPQKAQVLAESRATYSIVSAYQAGFNPLCSCSTMTLHTPACVLTQGEAMSGAGRYTKYTKYAKRISVGSTHRTRQYTTYSPSSPIYEEMASDSTRERARKMVTNTFNYDISNVIKKVYGKAMNDMRDVKEITRAVQTIQDDVQFYDAHNVAELSWALARLNLTHATLYKAMGKRLKALAKDMTPQEVSNTTWGFANNHEYRRDIFYPLSHRAVETLDTMNLQAMVVIVRSFAQVKDKDHLLFAKVAKKIRLFYEHLTPTDMAGVVSAFAFAGQSIVGSSVLPTLAKHTHVMIQSGNHKFLPNEIAMLVVNFEKVLVVTVSRPLTLALLKHAEAQYDDFSAHDRDMLRKLFVKSGWEQAFCMYPTQDEGLKSAGGQ